MCLPCFLGEESCVFLSHFHCLPGMHCVTCHNECTERWLPVNGIYLTASRVHSKAAELLEGLGGGGGLLRTDAEAQTVLSRLFPHP